MDTEIPPRPLLATDDADLLDDLLRISTAAQVDSDAAASVAAVRARWHSAPLIVVGADAVPALAAAAVPRRRAVIVVTRGEADAVIWQQAVAVGAEDVITLPAGEPWLVERFADLSEGSEALAAVIAVIGARGGAGASVLAAALAGRAGRAGLDAFLVDLDPAGPGADSVAGCDVSGRLGWGDLARTRGRIPSAQLAAGLPVSPDGVGVLTWSAEIADPPRPGAAGEAIDALRRAGDAVVVDLPRTYGDAVGEALFRASSVVLVVPRDSRSVTAAARMIVSPWLDGAKVWLATRGPSPAGMRSEDVRDALGIEVVADLGRDARLDSELEAGFPAGALARSPLGKAAAKILAECGVAV